MSLHYLVKYLAPVWPTLVNNPDFFAPPSPAISNESATLLFVARLPSDEGLLTMLFSVIIGLYFANIS